MDHFLRGLGIEIPIIQAGMAGGIATPELVAGVANTGALGTLGAGYASPEVLASEIEQVRKLTNKPFAVNVFATNLEATATETTDMENFLNTYRNNLGIGVRKKPVEVVDYLAKKIDLVIRENIQVVSTAFGVLSKDAIDRLKENEVTLIGMATNVAEAKVLETAGYDVIVAQGFEAGGHRGTFDVSMYPFGCNIGLLALVQSCLDHLSIPVVAAGGINTKEQINALLAMGVSGVQLGTRFLVAKEAGTNRSYRQALIDADSADTVITKVFSGRPARGIFNRFIKEVERSELSIEPFPIQNELTKDIRTAGKAAEEIGFQSLWAGQGVGAIQEEAPVQEIIDSLVD